METVTLKLTSDISLAGQIFKRGQLVEVGQAEAKNLLSRGKAELAVEGDKPSDEESDEV